MATIPIPPPSNPDDGEPAAQRDAPRPPPPPPSSREPLDPRLALALSALTGVLCGGGLLTLALALPRGVVLAGCLALLTGNTVAAWLHGRMRGTLPLQWLAVAVAGMIAALAFEHALYSRAGLLVSGSATLGMLLQAWRRPIEAIVAVGSIGTALTGHAVLYWAATLPEHATPAPIIRVIMLFGAAGSLMVGTSSALVWCRQNRGTGRARGRRPSWTESMAWTGFLVSLICAASIAVLREGAPPQLAVTWALAALANLGALAIELGTTLVHTAEDTSQGEERDSDTEPPAAG